MALVTAANYKTRAGIAGTTYDGIIALLIPEAEAKVASFCDRIIEDVGSDLTEYYDGTGTNTLTLKAYPITAWTSISYLSSVASSVASYTAYATDEYYYVADTGKVIRYSGIDYAFLDSPNEDIVWPCGPANIKVVYRGGYTTSTVPGDMKEAIYDLIGMLFHARNGTREEPTLDEVTAFLNDRIPHYRRVRM